MASSSGNSPGSPPVQSWGSEEGLIDQRKRKRMQSNRESARRSRMRKQKHLDDLMVQVAELRKENGKISSSIAVTAQQLVNMEAQNSILRAQMMELTHRLQSLNEILNYVSTDAAVCGGGSCMFESEEGFGDGFFSGSWNSMGMSVSHHPVMAGMFDY